jgi:tRNA nucleotidyltransferase/poly(A) polymerase
MKLKPKDKKQLKLLELIAEKVKSTIYNGHVFVTGEYVRDCIIGRKNSTINIVVDVQNGGIGLASWLSHVILKDCSAQDINEEGISSMVVDGIKFEFSQTVHNKNNDFGCLSDDALTRNFTVNALYYDICADEFIDPTGKAFSDIENGILRSCQDPITAFDD